MPPPSSELISAAILEALARAGSSGLPQSRLPGGRTAVAAALPRLVAQGKVTWRKLGRGRRFFLPAHTPDPIAEAAGKLRPILDRLAPFKLLPRSRLAALARLSDRLAQEGIGALIKSGEIVEFQSGAARFYASATTLKSALESAAQRFGADDSGEEDRVRAAYRAIVEEQGGFRSVPISRLSARSGLPVARLHEHILDAVKKRRAILHRLSDLPAPDEVAASLRLDREPEPFHNVEFGEF